METPLGLTYRPFFPIAQSFFKQQEQVKQLKAKQVAEERKTAETRVYNAVVDAVKFHPDRKYVHSLEPYFQKQADDLMNISSAVKRGEMAPDAIYEQMAIMQRDADAANRYDAQMGTYFKKFEATGNYNMEKIYQLYGNDTYDLTATQALGKATVLPPFVVDANQTYNKIVTNEDMYNKAALSEKFIASLMKTNAEQTIDADPAAMVIGKQKTLPNQFLAGLGNSGLQVLNMGEIGSDQSKVLLSKWRNMGPDYDNYLQLRASKENEGRWQEMTPDEKGIAMQKTLQKVMIENGYVPKEQGESYLKPQTDSDKAGTAYDKNKIGFSAKNESLAKEGAEFVRRVLSKDPRALAFFIGPNVQGADYMSDGTIRITPKAGKANEFADIASYGGSIDKNGVITIPNSRNGIAAIVHMRNAVATSTGGDWNDLHVEEYYKKKYPEGKRQPPAAAPAKKKIETVTPEKVAAPEKKSKKVEY